MVLKEVTKNIKPIYSGEEISNISSLGDVFRQIRSRLIREGISIEDARKNLLLCKKNRSNVYIDSHAKKS